MHPTSPMKVHGIGTWSQEDLVTYLKTGKLDNKAHAAGSMAEVISYSFQHLTDADLNAIATYVRSVPSAKAGETTGAIRFDKGTAGNDMAAFRGRDYADGLKGDHAGVQIFAANCASCHGYNAQGTKDGYIRACSTMPPRPAITRSMSFPRSSTGSTDTPKPVMFSCHPSAIR